MNEQQNYSHALSLFEQEKASDLALLRGKAVAEVFPHPDAEISLFCAPDGLWTAFPVGGPWTWCDHIPTVRGLDPVRVLAELLSLPATTQEEHPC